MSATTLSAGGPVAAPFATLSRLFATFAAALDAQHDHQRLQMLSDRQLAEMGLAREDVPRVVFERHFL